MRIPAEPRNIGGVIAWCREVTRYLRAITVTGVSGGKVQQTPNGTTIIASAVSAGDASGAGAQPCPFGEMTTWQDGEGESATTKTGIRGGVVYCGDRNFNVSPYEVNLSTAGTWLVYLELDCESNRDDDGEIILPGIKTSSETDPSTFWKKDAWSAGPPETQYPDNTDPTVADGIGTIRVPLGKLEVKDGAATFAKVDCGNITIGQCGGVLNHARG